MSKHPGVNRTPKENTQSGKPIGTNLQVQKKLNFNL